MPNNKHGKSALPQPKSSAATLTPDPSPRGRGECEDTRKNVYISGKGAKWVLRIDDGSTFEAPDIDILRRWAAEGRISPASEISRNGTDWQPAFDIPDLDMVWQVRLRDGERFGPLHIGAVFDLMADGLIAPDGPLDNMRTGQSVPFRQWLADFVQTGMGEHRPAVPADPDALNRLRQELRRKTDALLQTQGEYDALEKRLNTVKAQADASLSTHNDSQTKLLHRIEQLDAQIKKDRDQQQTYRSERDRLQERVAALETELQSAAEQTQALRDAASVAEQKWASERTAFGESISQLDQRVTVLTGERDKLREMLSGRDREHAALEQRWLSERTAFEENISQLDQRATALTGERDKLRETLSDRDRDYAASEQRWLSERTAFEESISQLDRRVTALTGERDTLRETLSGRDRDYAASEQRWLRERTVLEERVSDFDQRVTALKGERDKLRKTLTVHDRDRDASERNWLRERTTLQERLSELEQRMATLKRERDELRETLSGRDRDYAASEQRWLRERTAFEERIAEIEQKVPGLNDEGVTFPGGKSGQTTRKPDAPRKTAEPIVSTADAPKAPPRWRACDKEKSRQGSTVAIEPEVMTIPESETGRVTEEVEGGETMENLRRLEVQAQEELARWQSRKRKAANSAGAFRQWFARSEKS